MENDTSQYAQLGFGLKSVTGPRALNEDSAFIKEYISRARQQRYLCMAAVADGMGGHQAGEVASSTAVQSLFEEFNAQKIPYDRDPELDTRQLLYQLFSLVNTTVYDIAKRDNKLKGMGTTLTVFLAEAGRAYVAHVGDSRAYLIRGGSISQMTEDHTLVQDMVRDKIITREQAEARSDRNVITRAIGVDPTVEVDVISFPIQTGDILFLCSDGLYDVVSNHEILLLLTKSNNMQAACQDLVQLALNHGASDNVSAVAWSVPDIPAGYQQTSASKQARSTTGTVVLPPERAYSEGVQRPPIREKQTNKIVLVSIFTVVVIAGFILGWLIAGWVKGGEEEPQQETLKEAAQEEPSGSQETKNDLRAQTTLVLLDAKDTERNAANAEAMIRNSGYERILVGKATNDTTTTIYCDSGKREVALLLIEDLGLRNVTPKEDAEVIDTWSENIAAEVDLVVVLADGWFQE